MLYDDYEPIGRSYWEQKASKKSMEVADQLLKKIREMDPTFEFKFNKSYIGLAKDGKPHNIVILRPRKKVLRIDIRLPQSDEIDQKLEDSNLSVMPFDQTAGRYRIQLNSEDEIKDAGVLSELLREAYELAKI